MYRYNLFVYWLHFSTKYNKNDFSYCLVLRLSIIRTGIVRKVISLKSLKSLKTMNWIDTD